MCVMPFHLVAKFWGPLQGSQWLSDSSDKSHHLPIRTLHFLSSEWPLYHHEGCVHRLLSAVRLASANGCFGCKKSLLIRKLQKGRENQFHQYPWINAFDHWGVPATHTLLQPPPSWTLDMKLAFMRCQKAHWWVNVVILLEDEQSEISDVNTGKRHNPYCQNPSRLMVL